MRDKIVLGASNGWVTDRLLREQNLTLKRAFKQCRAPEATVDQLKMGAALLQVNVVKSKNDFIKKKACSFGGVIHGTETAQLLVKSAIAARIGITLSGSARQD